MKKPTKKNADYPAMVKDTAKELLANDKKEAAFAKMRQEAKAVMAKATPRTRAFVTLCGAGGEMAIAVNSMTTMIHDLNDPWWRNPKTGRRIKRNDGEMIALMHSELSEALEHVRKGTMDDKLPARKGEEVEMADTVIRVMDYCAGRGLDLGGAIVEKLIFNYTRADHKPENRLKKGGKKI